LFAFLVFFLVSFVAITVTSGNGGCGIRLLGLAYLLGHAVVEQQEAWKGDGDSADVHGKVWM
jgi:hypothetical protein